MNMLKLTQNSICEGSLQLCEGYVFVIAINERNECTIIFNVLILTEETDPSEGSPTETLLRLFLPLDTKS